MATIPSPNNHTIDKKRIFLNRLFSIVFRGIGLLCILILLAIFFMLFYNSVAFFLRVNPLDFISSTQWNPAHDNETSVYGLLSLLFSTLLVTLLALLIAIPLGIGTATFMAEYAPKKLNNVLKPLIEMLAAIPSVAIGFMGIMVVGPFIASIFHLNNGLNALNGAILLAIMTLPTIITITEDALHAVPSMYKEASYGLGASKWTTFCQITFPAALPGILSAVMLGMGRAIGETMTVLMATGNAVAFPENIFDSVRTITATIAIEMGEVPYKTTHFYSLFAIAFVLFVFTMLFNILAEKVASNFRKLQG